MKMSEIPSDVLEERYNDWQELAENPALSELEYLAIFHCIGLYGIEMARRLEDGRARTMLVYDQRDAGKEFPVPIGLHIVDNKVGNGTSER